MTAANARADDARPPQKLHEPWPDRARQMQAFTFGLWCFLATEVLFFGGLFASFAISRFLHHSGWEQAARSTNLTFGAVNTAVLLTSSLTMALAERGAEAELKTAPRVMLTATVVLALTFLAVKALEYREDLDERLWPGSAAFGLRANGAALFFGLYWMMTGVHAVHVIIGMALVGRILWIALRGKLPRHRLSVRMTTLYWHLVDVIWVVLFPLLYLGGRAT